MNNKTVKLDKSSKVFMMSKTSSKNLFSNQIKIRLLTKTKKDLTIKKVCNKDYHKYAYVCKELKIYKNNKQILELLL